MLDNVSVTTSDLVTIRADVEQYFLYEDQADFSGEISIAKRDVFADIKKKERIDYPTMSETDMNARVEAVTDVPLEKPLYYRICYLALATIFRNRNLLDMAEEYTRRAKGIELNYVLEDEDTAERSYQPRRIGR